MTDVPGLFYNYRLPTKLQEGNAFTGICYSVWGVGEGWVTSHSSWDRLHGTPLPWTSFTLDSIPSAGMLSCVN